MFKYTRRLTANEESTASEQQGEPHRRRYYHFTTLHFTIYLTTILQSFGALTSTVCLFRACLCSLNRMTLTSIHYQSNCLPLPRQPLDTFCPLIGAVVSITIAK